jgi:hypothetical protein
MNSIVVLNFLSAVLLAYSTCLAVSASGRIPRLKIPFLFIAAALGIALLVALSNILQHSAGFLVFDQIEEYFEVLILPLVLIFAFSWSSAQQIACSQYRLALLHHRVKNGLQIIEALLGTQAASADDEASRSALQDARWRITALGIAEKLSLDSGEPEVVDIGEYFSSIARSMGIDAEVEAEDAKLDSSTAAACGLVAAELFLASRPTQGCTPPRQNPTPRIAFARSGKERCSIIFDGGAEDLPRFSQDMLRAMTRQLEGELYIDNNRRVSIDFPLNRKNRT